MKTHVIRLVEGNDLRDSIEMYCKEHTCGNACVLTCVGCVKELKLRMAGGKTFLHKVKDYEIVSLVGTISLDGAHLHFSGSDIDGNTIGGHLTSGTIVNTTAEIVIMELDEYCLTREFDERTGYKELVIRKCK